MRNELTESNRWDRSLHALLSASPPHPPSTLPIPIQTSIDLLVCGECNPPEDASWSEVLIFQSNLSIQWYQSNSVKSNGVSQKVSVQSSLDPSMPIVKVVDGHGGVAEMAQALIRPVPWSRASSPREGVGSRVCGCLRASLETLGILWGEFYRFQ